MPKTAKSWSASAYQDYADCPKRFEFARVQKIKAPVPSRLQKIFDRGTRVHWIGEMYLLGQIIDVADAEGMVHGQAGEVTEADVNTWWPWIDYLDDLAQDGAMPEQEWAFTRDLTPTRWDDWQGAWVRGKTDAHLLGEQSATLYIQDFKTGRVYRGKHAVAAEIYAWLGHIRYPEAERVEFEFWYLDSGPQSLPLGEHEFDRKQLVELAGKWRAKGEELTTANKFVATPGDACKFCPFSKFKKLGAGRGPCQYAVED